MTPAAWVEYAAAALARERERSAIERLTEEYRRLEWRRVANIPEHLRAGHEGAHR